jgi:hypothetical protein
MRLPRARLTVPWLTIGVATIALLMSWYKPELNRRWMACETAARRHEEAIQMDLEFAYKLEREAERIASLLRGEAVNPEAAARESSPQLDPHDPAWSRVFALNWRKACLERVAVIR